MLIRTAVYHDNVNGLNKYIGLACKAKLTSPIHKAAYKPVIRLVLVSYKHAIQQAVVIIVSTLLTVDRQ